MPGFNPHHSRTHRGRQYQVWRYLIHYSPVSPVLQFGISKDGQVVHRARDLPAAKKWAVDQVEAFYNRTKDVVHPLRDEMREVLEQYGRLTDAVAQA